MVEALGVPRVIMIPDEYLAQNIAKQTGVRIISWAGHCEVHERFTPADVRDMRDANPGVFVLAHPECPPDVVAEADYSGSTAGMIHYVADAPSAQARAADGMLHERQRRRAISRARLSCAPATSART